MKILTRVTALSVAAILVTTLTTAVAYGATPESSASTPTSTPTSWPRTYAGPEGGLLTVYQPQVDAWRDRVQMKAHAAVKVELGGKTTYGSVWIDARTRADQRAGTVTLEEIELVRSSFPELSDAQAKKVEGEIKSGMKEADLVLPLPSALASLAKEKTLANPPKLSEDAPHIYYSATPAILVALDGRTVMVEIPGTQLSYVANTNWNVFVDRSDHEWYLLDGESWLTSHLWAGPWKPAKSLPDEFSKLPDDAAWKSVRDNVPGKPFPEGQAPKVFLTMGPAELVLTEGPPEMEAIEGTSLLYVKNSPNDLFLDKENDAFYVLFGGRWFTTSSLEEQWTSAAGELPSEFAKIPPDSPRGSVLVAVPGTPEAKEAALQAEVPQLATVERDKATLDVVYAGDPDFEPIEGTDLEYAVNTTFAVVHAGDMYYSVSNGVWFESASPTGPWVVAAVVPPVLYTIPPTSPLYPITFVRVYSYTPTTVVVGYTAGYVGTYVWGGTVVFGTGYYYPPFLLTAPVPGYFPYFRTYSVATWYNPATGAYGRGAAVVGPYGGAGAGWAYNPETGAYARGARAYGPYGGAGYVAGYNPSTGTWARAETQYGPDGRSTWAQGGNPWTGTYARTQQHRTPYAQWGSSTVTRGGETTNAAHYSNARGSVGGFESTTGAKGAGYHTESGKSGGVVKRSGGDVYADHNGNVYRHSSDDGWQKYDDGGWQNVDRSAESRPDGAGAAPGGLRSGLDQDRGARGSGLFGGSLGGGRFEESRGRRFGGGFGGDGFGRGGGGFGRRR